MPNGTSIRNVTGLEPLLLAGGNFGIREIYPKQSSYLVAGVTGGHNSVYPAPGGSNTTSVSDISYTPGATTLIKNQEIFAGGGSNTLRFYLDSMIVSVMGATSWAGGNYVAITDLLGNLGVYIPVSALQANAQLRFGFVPETRQSMLLTASSFNSATGVVTFPATSFVNAAYSATAPWRIVAGTGQGLAGIIASNTATTMTPVGGALAFPIQTNVGATAAVDSTSVFEFPYWAATAEGGTTLTLANQGGSATPLGAGLANGNWAVDVSQSPQGVRLITSNTNSVITVPTWVTNPTTGDLIALTNAPALNGSIDFATGGMPCFGLGQGVQVLVASGMTQGSPMHIEWFGHVAQ